MVQKIVKTKTKKVNTSLQKKLKDLGFKFKKDGSIKNYKKGFNSLKKKYNDQVEVYNSVVKKYKKMSAKQQKAKGDKMLKDAKKELDNAKKAYDTAQDYLTRYDEVLAEIRQNEEDQKDLIYQQIENNLQKFELKFQLKLDLKEAQRTINDFTRKISKNFKKSFDLTEAVKDQKTLFDNAKTYVEGNNSTIKTDLNELAEIQKIIDNKQYGENGKYNFASESEAMTKYMEVYQRLVDDSTSFLDLQSEMWSNYLSALNGAFDEWNNLLNAFDKIQNQLDHAKNLIDLLQGGADTKTGRESYRSYYASTIKTTVAELEGLKKSIAEAKELQKTMVEGEDDYKQIQEQIDSWEQQERDKVEFFLETAKANLENEVALAQIAMDEKFFGKSLSKVQEEWNDSKVQAEGYYDTIQRIYQLESLESKWESTISSTKSAKAQKQLTNFMKQQRKELEAKTVLSEKDVALAEKELEMYKAQIALEEAQKNKTSMKLTRNAQGNWTYQYVANQEDINKKQDEYLAKVDDYRTTAINYSKEVSDSVLSAYQDFSERQVQIMTDTSLSMAERLEAIKNLNELYWGTNGIITRLNEESNYMQSKANEATFIELQTLYDQDKENYNLMTEDEKAIVDNFQDYVMGSDPKEPGGVYGQIIEASNKVNENSVAGWRDIRETINKLMITDDNSAVKILASAFSKMLQSFMGWKKTVYDNKADINTDWEDIGGYIGQATSATGAASIAVDTYVTTVNTAVTNLKTPFNNLNTYWTKLIEEINAATTAAGNYQNKLSGVNTVTLSNGTTITDETGGKVSSSKTTTTTTVKNEVEGIKLTKIGEATPANKPSKGVTKMSKDGFSLLQGKNKNTWYLLDATGRKLEKYTASSKKEAKAMALDGKFGKKAGYKKFATGGYTGDWDDSQGGKLGILHSKELILNKEDTSNILDAVNIVRSIKNSIGGMMSQLSGLNTQTVSNISNNNSNSNQNINITAEFPNANNVAEIQEAIMSLPRLASQYISRNLK